MKDFYIELNVSKQSVHQMRQRKINSLEENEMILPLVRKIRKDHPCMSAREIYFKIRPSHMGRDKFEQFCFNNGFRVVNKPAFRKPETKEVIHFPNLIKEIKVTGVNQVFVSDITYYELGRRFYYLTFVMDLSNREVVGYSVSKSLRTVDTTLPALRMAAKTRGKKNLKGAIFHSDGGGQFYSTEFTVYTNNLEMRNSMTEWNVFQNSAAERLNGVLKNNYIYRYMPTNFAQLEKETKRAVTKYNWEKGHRSLGGLTPVEYRSTRSIDSENNTVTTSTNEASERCYFPLSTEVTTINNKFKKENQMSNLVNPI